MPNRLRGVHFESAEITGTAAPQLTPHGLGRRPVRVQVIPSQMTTTDHITAISWDDVNVTVTAPATTKYRIFAEY